jgi:hypothetical protein
MKYIICEDFSGQPVPFFFPDRVAHQDMRDVLPYAKVISAGYVALAQGRFVCTGGDAELGATARAEDSALLADFFAEGQDPSGGKHSCA